MKIYGSCAAELGSHMNIKWHLRFVEGIEDRPRIQL